MNDTSSVLDSAAGTRAEADAAAPQPRAPGTDDRRDMPLTGSDGLAHLTRRLAERELPAFARTTRALASEAVDRDSSVADLSRIVLQDPSMTSRLLKMANSSFFNPAGTGINTVSRAIVVLGFDAVRNISVSIALIDNLLRGEFRDRILGELGQAYHAAVQARSLASLRGDRDLEEVFIASLLLPLGRMAFWCAADQIDPELARRLDRALRKNPGNPERVERRILGYPLGQLTAGLNREWRLSSLLQTALAPGGRGDPRAQSVRLGHELARTASQGWDGAPMDQLVHRIQESLGLRPETIFEHSQSAARDTALGLSALGLNHAARLVPVPARFADQIPAGDAAGTEAAQPGFLPADPEVVEQTRAVLAQGHAGDVSPLIQATLEGVLRGVGADRVVFALLSPDRHQIRAKYALGWDQNRMLADFHFALGPLDHHAVREVVSTGAVFRGDPGAAPDSARLITPALRRICGDSAFFIMPVRLAGKTIGIIYADRRPSRRPLDNELWDDFRTLASALEQGLATS